jgi:RHS repeat-associated protein
MTGLDYFLARYYSSAQGRFTSPDEFSGGPVDPSTGQQIQQPGPLPYADITNPQSLNKYAYVLNNPLRYTDPDGHCGPVCALVGGVIGAGINVGVTYFTKSDATVQDYEGAAASGFLTGTVAGFTGGASLLVEVGANAGAAAIGGVIDRSISSGQVKSGTVGEIARDAAIGAAGPLLKAAGGKVVKAVSGQDAEALASRAEGAKLGPRHKASLERQAEAAKANERAGERVGTGAGQIVDSNSRAKENRKKKEEER